MGRRRAACAPCALRRSRRRASKPTRALITPRELSPRRTQPFVRFFPRAIPSKRSAAEDARKPAVVATQLPPGSSARSQLMLRLGLPLVLTPSRRLVARNIVRASTGCASKLTGELKPKWPQVPGHLDPCGAQLRLPPAGGMPRQATPTGLWPRMCAAPCEPNPRRIRIAGAPEPAMDPAPPGALEPARPWSI